MIILWELQDSMYMLVLWASMRLLIRKYRFSRKIYLTTMEIYKENILLSLIARLNKMVVYTILKNLRVLLTHHGFPSSLETQ